MAKKKRKVHPKTRKPNQQRAAQSRAEKYQPNNGSNREEKRAQAQKPARQRSSKPTWLRIAIIVVLLAILLGFVLSPLLRA